MDEDRAPIDQFEEMVYMAIELMDEQLTYAEVVGALQIISADMADQALGN
jgi:hypothetical protein